MTKESFALQSIAREMENLPGHLGFYYKNLATGLSFGIREEEAYLAASVIKLPLFLHILTRCDKDAVAPSAHLTVREEEKLPSCGALSLFTGPVEADITSLCRLMIALSDNTATNVLIRHFGMEEVNRGFREMGLRQTVLRRLLFDREASAAGLENTVSPKEMGTLLEQVYRGSFVSPEISRQAMDTLLLQQINHKIGGRLRGVVPMAHKTGEDYMLSNDVGIVLAREPFIVCFTGHDTDVYPWEDLMRRGTYALWQAAERNG